jgi:ABC-type sugar transport system substrate-binding protein
MIRRHKVAAVAAALAGALLASGCGTLASGGAAQVKGSGTLDGAGRTIVAFIVSTANNYVGADAKAMQAEATKLNYRLEVIDNKFDQTEQDQQVRQYLASGRTAAAFIYWPANNDTGVNSARLLAAKAPVFQLNGRLLPQAEKYVTAVAGQDNESIGAEMSTMALQAVAAAKTKGTQFHGPGGKPNLLEVTYPSGYETGIVRHDAFFAKVGDTFNLLATENAATADAQGGFTAASQVIPKYQGQGIDVVLAGSNNIGAGVVKALQQNGLTPGKDVTVVVGDFSGDKQPLIHGQVYGAVLQSPVIEGTLIVQTAARYLSAGKVVDGTVRLPVSPNEPVITNTAPSRFTYMPNPAITPDNYKTLRVWGLGVDQLEF